MTQRFRPGQHIRRRSEFLRVYEHGRKVHGRLLTVFVLPTDLDTSRLGISATRKFGGAVQRNLAKRRIREVFRRQVPRPACDVVVVPKSGFLDAHYSAVDHEFQALLRRAARPGRR